MVFALVDIDKYFLFPDIKKSRGLAFPFISNKHTAPPISNLAKKIDEMQTSFKLDCLNKLGNISILGETT